MGIYVITGGSSGIGKRTVEILKERGHETVNIDLKDGDINANLATPAGRSAALTELHRRYPDGIDAMICNAGVNRNIPLIISLNYFGATEMAAGAFDLLKKKGGSCVVTSSNSIVQGAARMDVVGMLNNQADEARILELVKDYDPRAAHSFYAATKYALARWARRRSASWGAQGVRLNAVAPGNVRTAMTDGLSPEQRAAVEALPVPVNYESGELMDVSFTAENSGDLRVEAAAHFTDVLAPVIPDDVLTAIHSGSNDDASTLTDNALRLLAAWGELTADDLSADIALSADCGPIVLNSTLQYDRSSIDGQSYGSIQKNTLAVYFSGSKICDADGNSVDTASQQLIDATSLIDLCYQSILNGSAGCDKVSDGYLYGLSLDSDAMSELAAAIAPDIKAQDVTFSSGRISVRVSEQGELQSVNISCSGALHLILSDAPVSLSAVITPADRAFSIPQPALNALKQ